MARISVTHRGDGYRVRVRGELAAGDLHRLEQACGRALERPQAPLELDLTAATLVDEVAQTFVARLRARGATLVS
ncbi:MAG: hypothetical protein AB7I50_01835 [Vicinamibacterales bacterium]